MNPPRTSRMDGSREKRTPQLEADGDGDDEDDENDLAVRFVAAISPSSLFCCR